MNASTIARRPLWNRFLSALDRLSGRRSRAGRLFDRAGLGGPVSGLESLEARQLLFTLTITPDLVNPVTGLGQVTDNFGYAIPRLRWAQPVTVQPDTAISENFDDEATPPLTVPRDVASGTTFAGAQTPLQLFHNITPATDARLVLTGGTGTEAALRLRVQQSEFFSFRVLSQTGALDVMRSFAFDASADAGGSVGLPMANLRITLFFAGEVVDTYTGATEIGALSSTGGGVGRFTIQARLDPGSTAREAFDEVRFEALSGTTLEGFRIDNVTYTLPSAHFAGMIDAGWFGATVTFAGPVGASVQFLDLYGRDMLSTLGGKVPQGGRLPVVDRNGDGIYDYNDGIGQIIFRNTDSRTSMSMVGGTIMASTTPDTTAEEFSAGNNYFIITEVAGLFGAFEQAGFGYVQPTTGTNMLGLPPGPGSVIIGAPFLRPAGYNLTQPAVTSIFDLDFVRADQGLRTVNGASLGKVSIHGVVHGVSTFTGALDAYEVGYQVGTVTVAGDLGLFSSASDAGLWVPDPQNSPITVDVRRTLGQLVVGRAVNEIRIGGRSLLDVTVVGDLNSPTTRPPRDVYRYFEKEGTPGVPYTLVAEDVIKANLGRTVGHGEDQFFFSDAIPLGRNGVSGFFGLGYYRNDTILGSEWAGSAATAVQIHGELGFGNPVSNADDPSDVFGFATDGVSEIVLELEQGIPGQRVLLRVVDQDGRTVAGGSFDDRINGTETVVRFLPPAPGVYYAVISSPVDATATTGSPYVLTIGGMAPTILGAYHVGGGSGRPDADTGLSNTVLVLDGSIGSIRVGGGIVAPGGGDSDPSVVMNFPQATGADALDNRMRFDAGTFSTPEHVYAITLGGDLGDSTSLAVVSMNVGGNLGRLTTGLSGVIGTGPLEGDIGNFLLTVGKSIGVLDVRGAIGIEQDVQNTQVPPLFAPNSIQITTGDGGEPGHIGLIRAGSHMGGDTMRVTTSPGSVVGGFLVSQDIAFDPNDERIGIYFGDVGVVFTTGSGSDVRFVDFPRIDLVNTVDAFFPIIGGQDLNLVDDAGGRLTIRVPGAPQGATLGQVRVMAVDGSQGVAVGLIRVNLAGGLQLNIDSQSQAGLQDTVSIGKIEITGADANSSIFMSGTSQVDVFRIVQTGGDAFGTIVNNTPGGDIVAADVVSLTRIEAVSGDIGRTQVPVWGPRLIGPFMGVAQGGDDTAGGPIGVDQNSVDNDWNGGVYRPVNNVTVDPGTAFLDDIGSPVSPYLNGVVVRTGDLTDAIAGGAIGDIVVQAGNLVRVTPNADSVTAPGRFDGLVGVIYADNIFSLDVGDGLVGAAQSPITTAGVFADDDIHIVRATRIPGAFIHGQIVARNNVANDRTALEFLPDGIESIQISGGGDIADAFFATELLDGEWFGVFLYEDGRLISGDLGNIIGTDADLLRSQIHTGDVGQIQLTGGVWDGTELGAQGDVASVEAVEFLNSTRLGSDREFRRNEIFSGGFVGVIRTFGGAGDMSDLLIDVLGSVTTEIGALNFNRVDIGVDSTIATLSAAGDFRGSSVVAGQLQTMSVGQSVVSGRITISGPILSLTAAEILNTAIEVTGPDGRIDLISATGLISGSIAASGPIDTVESTGLDIVATITTTTERGNINVLSAARDLDIVTDISGTVQELLAGRHIGNRISPSVILVRGSLDVVDVSGGQLYSDLRIGQSLTGSVTIGAVSNKPGANLLGSGSVVAFGRIELVEVSGDFGGRIISHSGGIGTVSILSGSLLSEGEISAFDGDIGLVQISSGHLLGSVYADYLLANVEVLASADGVFGDIGVNPALSSAVSAGDLRNQLPPGVAPETLRQGARIGAGQGIGRVFTSGGSVFESTITAGRSIGTLEINGSIANDAATPGYGTQIIAGDVIVSLTVTGDVSDTLIVAGPVAFGSDGALGGLNGAADTVRAARVQNVTIGGSATRVRVTAGMTVGPDGQYGTSDDRHALGWSHVANVTVGGTVTDVVASADSGLTNASPGVAITGRATPVVGGRLFSFFGVPRDSSGAPIFSSVGTVLTPGQALAFTHGSDSGTITFTGPGTAIWDAANGRLILANTRLASSLVVTSTSGRLTDFDIISNDDASLGTLDVRAVLAGDSDVLIDAYVFTALIQGMEGTGSFFVGNDVQVLNMASFDGGVISGVFVRSIGISGNTGGRIDIFGSSSVDVTGVLSGVISLERSLGGPLNVNGGIVEGSARSGGFIGSLIAGSLSDARVSARDGIGSVTITGSVFDSAIIGGGDLGDDAVFGGTGANADRATSGSIGSVGITGSFTQSDIISGSLRGPDGFFGSSDDTSADGRSNIGTVSIGGSAVGSNLGSESYRISATGTVGAVTAAGQTLVTAGNLSVTGLPTEPLPIIVTDLQVTEASRVYTGRLFFNQPMDTSTFSAALSVSELRPGGVEIRLVEGLDYTISYRTVDNSLGVELSRDITERGLPITAGVPGPGVYRFDLNADILRASVIGARLDGDGDGFAAFGEDYSEDDFIGDAGDKATAEVITVTNPSTGLVTVVDAYAPVDLNQVLDNNRSPDGLPDANRSHLLIGRLGDHPDHDVSNFQFSGDLDVYRITIQAGQILRLGVPSGAAAAGTISLFDSSGDLQGDEATDAAVILPAPVSATNPLIVGITYLVKETGTYDLVAAAAQSLADQYLTAGSVPNIAPVSGAIGEYRFTVEVFDDGDSGFRAPSDSGNGQTLIDAPEASAFAGPDQTFGTSDDVASVVNGAFTFVLDPVNGVLGDGDDVVTGSNGLGIVSVRNPDGTLISTVSSSIGPARPAGVPSVIAPDVDVYHVNNGLSVQPGTRYRVTVRLTDLGADLGARTGARTASGVLPPDFSGAVQLAVFETTATTGMNDATLVLSPSEFQPTGARPGTIASGPNATYGYDDRGDFFVEFVSPGSMADPTAPGPATYAVYLQGVLNTDYVLEVATLPGLGTFTRTEQNIFLETLGGTIDWLEVDRVTELLDFSAASLGFTGPISGQAADLFVLNSVVTRLNEIFDAAGVAINLSTTPATFEGEQFSTVFLSASSDPVNFFSDRIYGYSQQSDPLNADAEDEAVVFIPTLATLGLVPSEADARIFSDALAAAVARRIGELVGLRMSLNTANGVLTVDPMSANSVDRVPGTAGVYRFQDSNRLLSPRGDTIETTDFFLGELNSLDLLRTVVLAS